MIKSQAAVEGHMRVTRAKSAKHRSALVTAASALLQKNGFEGAGVIEISAQAGLTQGALYGQFASKSVLAAEACRQSYDNGLQAWIERRGTTESDFLAYLDQYFRPEHVENAAAGCPMAAYASEVRRQDKVVKDAFTEGYLEMVKLMQAALPKQSAKAARKRALLLISAMAGSVAMARATEAVNPSLSQEIIAAAKEELEKLAALNT